MNNLYQPGKAEELKQRIARLTPDRQRQWGTMTAPQAVAHCSAGMEMATGDKLLPRSFIGRLIGWMIKTRVVGDDAPFRRNSPTHKSLVVTNEPDLQKEQQRLCELIDRFVVAGPQGCTKHPHTFFGPLTPDEWATLTYKHLDHHLRQFGV